jgi:hypothetical protein
MWSDNFRAGCGHSEKKPDRQLTIPAFFYYKGQEQI